MSLEDFKTEPLICSYCSWVTRLAQAAQEDSPPPHPGCIVLCVSCNGINVMTETGTLRQITAIDLIKMSRDEIKQVGHALWAMKEAKRRSAPRVN